MTIYSARLTCMRRRASWEDRGFGVSLYGRTYAEHQADTGADVLAMETKFAVAQALALESAPRRSATP